METLEVFFVEHPGLCLLLMLGSALVYAAVSLWLWHRKNKGSEPEARTIPDWAKSLPPVYTAENVRKGQAYWIWCPETMREQRFRVLKMRDDWFYVRFEEADGSGVHEGWALEIPSNAHLHKGHLTDHVPKKFLAA